ncbi:hypothetical protein SAMN05444401_0430 [Clostridium amylolyticum]|uniref:Uncharacterized protein n=1 Tax=Clostridium amylolyticum TaxID=1121298 RepID=A0A1M6P683_9CLOT|nr:hypothetical protein SAMN05444401_0430 [Clostridium amylolyticum]
MSSMDITIIVVVGIFLVGGILLNVISSKHNDK